MSDSGVNTHRTHPLNHNESQSNNLITSNSAKQPEKVCKDFLQPTHKSNVWTLIIYVRIIIIKYDIQHVFHLQNKITTILDYTQNFRLAECPPVLVNSDPCRCANGLCLVVVSFSVCFIKKCGLGAQHELGNLRSCLNKMFKTCSNSLNKTKSY